MRYRVGSMRVLISPAMFREARLDIETNMLVARSAMYLDYGWLACLDLIRGQDESDRADVIQTAKWFGIQDDDTVEIQR